MDYESWKKKIEENKPKIVLAVCFVLVFFVGFGVGRFEKETKNGSKNQTNYTTSGLSQPKQKEVFETEIAGVATSSVPASGECKIKGNISAKGSRIYHVPGGAFYNLTKPEQCFETEEAARAAGFTKSSR